PANAAFPVECASWRFPAELSGRKPLLRESSLQKMPGELLTIVPAESAPKPTLGVDPLPPARSHADSSNLLAIEVADPRPDAVGGDATGRSRANGPASTTIRERYSVRHQTDWPESTLARRHPVT